MAIRSPLSRRRIAFSAPEAPVHEKRCAGPIWAEGGNGSSSLGRVPDRQGQRTGEGRDRAKEGGSAETDELAENGFERVGRRSDSTNSTCEWQRSPSNENATGLCGFLANLSVGFRAHSRPTVPRPGRRQVGVLADPGVVPARPAWRPGVGVRLRGDITASRAEPAEIRGTPRARSPAARHHAPPMTDRAVCLSVCLSRSFAAEFAGIRGFSPTHA